MTNLIKMSFLRNRDRMVLLISFCPHEASVEEASWRNESCLTNRRWISTL